jgi:hypothetical protein
MIPKLKSRGSGALKSSISSAGDNLKTSKKNNKKK